LPLTWRLGVAGFALETTTGSRVLVQVLWPELIAGFVNFADNASVLAQSGGCSALARRDGLADFAT
jgi:hypothetical protein